MANALSYIRNVGKSVKYMSIEVAKEMNPTIKGFNDTNSNIMKDMYLSVKTLKRKSKEMPAKIMESQYTEFGRTFLRNLKQDISTGQFYNRERINEYDEKATMSMLGDNGDGMDFDFGSMDDGLEQTEMSSNEMMDLVGEKSSTAVASAVAKSAEYIMQGTGEIAKAQYRQMNAVYAGLHTGMGTINKNVTALLQFSTETTTTHYENSKKFYESVNNADQEKITLLKEISENIKKISDAGSKDSKGYSSKKKTYSDMTDSDGIVDLETYFESVKKNIKDRVGEVTDMLDMMSDKDMLMTFASSPVSLIMQEIMPKLLPKVVKTSMESFNKTLGGMFGSALLKLKETANEKGGFWDLASDILGVNNSMKTTLDPSKYEKGRVPFDGITRKAIVEVIPTYLSKIYSALSGNQQDRFDYETGKFVTMDQLQKQLKDVTKFSRDSAMFDVDDLVKSKMKKDGFKSDKERKAFERDWEALKDYMFKNQRVFNTRQKKSASSYGLKGGMASEVNLEILRQMLDGTPEMMMLANNIMQGRDSVTRQMKELESRGDSVFTALQNGSVEQKSDADKKSSPIAGINNGVINELKAIHKEISYIRLYGIRGRGGSGSNKRHGPIPSFDSFDLDALSNVKPRSGDKDYDKNHAEYEDIPDLTKEEIKSYAAERIDDKYDAYGRNTKSKTKSKSFSAQVREAQGLSAKAAVVVENIKNLAKRPGEFIASVYDKADERMYDFIYGPKEDKTGKKSFSGRLFNRLEQIFDKFSTFIDDTIITPLKAKINKQNIHDAASRFFSMFGINLDETVDKMKQFFFGKKKDGRISEKGLFTDFQQGLSKEFKNVGSWIKDAFAEAGDDLGLDGSKKKQSLELSKQLRDIKIKYAKLGGNTDDLTQAASGMRMVDKTGLAVISEGEMIIPPDMDPLNIAKRYRKERAVKNKLKSNGVDNIMMYAKGKIVQFDRNRKAKKAVNESSAQGHEMTEEEYNAEIDARKKAQTDEKKEEIRNNILNSLLKKYQKISGNKKDVDESRWKFSDAASDALRGFGNSIHDVVEKEIKESGLFGDEKEVETLKKRGKNLFQQAKEALPSLTTGATLGAGLSLMTGFIGGPLIGAGIGAAVGLAKRSESFQNFLFGEQKDGEYQGGIIFSKELSNNIHKYLPGMAKSATVGGIITALPLVPGGPVAGIVLGSAFGFAKNSETVQNALFGEGKLFENKEQFQNKMRSVLPKMGIGAAAGLLAGPFGMTTNILLGSALGFASDTDKFKDFMFGAVDPETNERTGGLFGSITRPAIDFFHDMFVEFKGFVKDKILEPIKTAFEPLANQFHLMMDSVTGFFKDWISEKVGQPIHRMMERLTKKVFGGIKSVLGFILKPAFWAAQMPIRAFSRLGDTARKHQVKTGGTRKTMSAAARNAYRRSKGAKMLIGGRDHFAQFDESLENMDYEQIEQFQDMLAGVESSRLTAKKAHQESFNKIRNVVWSKDFDLKKTAVGKEVLRLIKSGYYEDALKYIDRLGTDPSKGGLTEEQKDKLRGVINKEASKMKMADKARKSRPEAMNELYGQLGSLGMNMDRKLFDKITGSTHEVNKIRDMLNYEKSLRGGPIAEQLANPNKVISEEQKQRHTEIKDKLDKIIENLTKISDISSSLYTDDLKNQEERFKYVSSHGEEGEENPELAERTHILPFIRRGVKKVAGAPIKGVKAGSKIVSMTTGAVKGAAGKVRNTNTMNKVFGDKNTDWKKKAAVVSEGEAIISDVDDAKEHAVGSLGGKNRREGANPLFDLFKNIEKGIKLIAASSVSKSSNDGIDIDTAAANKKGSVVDFVKKAKNKAKNAARYITQFVDGHPIKLFKDKNGDQEIDPSSAETKNSLKIIQDKENTQKGILASLTSLPSKIGSFFKGGDKEEKEESWFSKIVGGIKNLASIIPTGLKVAGGLTAGAVLAEKASPYLESFWNETVHPYLSASWNGEKDGFGKFIYFFNPANPDGLLEKFKTFMQEDFPTIAKTIAAYTGDAVNWALTNVLPGLVTSLITNFPTAMVGVGKGIIAGVDNLISGRKKNDGKLDDVKVYPAGGAYKTGNAAAPKWMRDSAKDIQLGSYDWDNMKFDSSGSTVGYDIDSNISKVRNMSETVEEAKKDGVTPNLKYEDTGKKTKSGTKTYTVGGATVVKKDPLNGKLPKAFNFIPEAYKSKAISEYEKVKYAVVDMSGYGVMTVGEVLNSDTVVLGVTGDGEEITGSHALEHYETSKMLGMEVKLSQDEIKANTAAVGSYGTTTGSKLTKGGLKGITRSLLGASTGVKGGSKVVEGGAKAVGALTRLIPGVGKYSQKGLNKLGEGSAKGMGKASKGLQKLGVKLGLNKGSIKENGSTLFEFLDDIAKGDLSYDEVADVVKELDAEKAAEKAKSASSKAASKAAKKTKTKKSSFFDRFKKPKEVSESFGADVIDVIDADGTVLKHADDGATAASKFANNVLALPGETMDGKTVDAVAGLTEKAAKSSTTEVAKTAGKEVAEKALKDGAGNALGEIASSQKKGILGKFIDLVKSGISKVLNSPVVQKYFKGAIKGIGKGVQKATANLDKLGVKLGTKVAELLAKHGGKMGAKAAAKIGAYAGSALVILVADALLSFTLGVKNANNIVGTVEQPDAFTRFLCGLANCVNEVFLLGLVPLNLVVDIIIKLGEECLGMDFGELSEQREEAQRIVDEYNEEHGTDLTIEEYNNKDKLWTKVKKGASDLWEGAKDLGGKAVTKAKEFGSGLLDKAKGVGDKAKEFGSGLLDKAKGVGDKAKDLGGKVITKAKDLGKKAKESIMGKSSFTEEELSELDEYNKKNGTNISAEEYYNGGKIGYEIKKGIDNVVTGAKKRIDTAVDLASYAGKVFKDTWDELVTGEEKKSPDLKIDANDPYHDHKYLIYSTIKIAAFIPGQIAKLARNIYEKALKPLGEGIVTVGKGIGNTVTDMFTNAWNGDIKNVFTAASRNAGFDDNDMLKYVSMGANTAVASMLAVPTLLTSGIGFVVRHFESFVDGVKTMGSGIGKTVSGMFSSAWKGDMKGVLSSAGENAQFKDNQLLNTMSMGANGVVGALISVPTLLTAGVGVVARNFNKVVSGLKTIGSSLGKNVQNMATKAWSGHPIQALTDNSANANTDNNLINKLSAGINFASKVMLSPMVFLTAAVGKLKDLLNNVVSGLKTIGNSMTSMVSNVMSKATSGENPASAIFTTEGDARTGNKLVDYTSTVINTIVKIPLTPVAMLTYGVNKVANGIKTFASTLAEAGTLSDADQKLVDQAKEGDINPFTKKYWTVNTSLTGVAKGFNTFISIFHKVMALPQALVGYLNPLSLAKKGAKWVLDKLGIDDSETGSGSGAKGAAITTGVAGAAAGKVLGTATDAVKSVTGGGSGQKAAEENRFRNAVRKSQDTERAINEKVSDNTFVSQLDPRYANKRFNIKGDTQAQTLGDTGCAPAAATMAINGTLGQRQESMASAAKSAIKYKLKNDGVNAAYFNEEFAKNGMSAQYITTSDSNERANQIKKHLSNHNRVVLLGQDPTNSSKKQSPYGPDKHYIVANGMSKDGKYIYINDPESSKANVKYPANKILSNSSLGIAAATAKGSNLPNLRDKILYTISGRGALPGSDVAEKCWNYIRSRGCSEAATAGMLGNFQQETGMNPAVDGGPAAGLYQMEKSTGHFAQYCAYAKSKGCDWTDLKCQLDWLFEGGKMEETFKTYTGKQPHYYSTGEWCWWPQKMTWDEFKKLDDVAKATEIFERVYERGSITRMDKRIQYAKEYYQRFTGKFVKVDGTSSDGGSGEGESSQSNSGTWVDKVYGVFDKLATAYGLKSNESSGSSDGSSSGGVVGGSDKQKALVNQMKSIEGKLAYAQNNAQFPGPRSAEGGISSDCSETCQWAYKKVLNVDPGSWTGAMETDDDTYTVTTSFDESKMQPGDLILYNGHVEMYAGDGQMIGHGGPGKGPTTKKLSDQGRFRMIRRWKGFKDGGESSGSGSGLFVGRGTDPTKSSKNATNKFSYVENSKFSSRPYKKVENLISKGNVKTWLPPEYDQEKFEEKDIQISNIDNDGVMIDSNKIDTNKIKRASARGSNVDLLRNLGNMLGRTQTQKKDDGNSRELIILIKTIVQLLSSVVKNTEQLNNIAKLLGDYLSETGKSGSDSKTALIAKQNLINAMQGGNNSVNEQLMRLIESTEMIASE